MRNSQTPSIYSIYNNALPFYLDRIDLSTLTDSGNAFAVKFVSGLLNGDLTIQFDASNLVADRARHLFFESRNLAKVAGVKTFGFGYPHLIDTYEGELMVAPLFIWQLTLEPAQTKMDAWVIRSDQGHHVQPNFQLISYLKKKYDFDYTDQLCSLVRGSKLNKRSLEHICTNMVERFHFEDFREDGQVIASPGIDQIGSIAEKGAVHWSGVLGIYPPQHFRWKPGTSKPEDVFAPSKEDIGDAPFVFPYLPADPEQVTAVEQVLRKKMSVVEGVDALGKTQTLLNLIICLLMQGRKCLVVSERAPALKKVQELLAKAGIGQLHFLLTDALNDKDQLLEFLRVAAKGVGKDIRYDQKDFNYKKNKFIRGKARLDEAYVAVKSKVFGDYDWTDTVGLFLSSHKKEGKELLASHLNRTDFKFVEEEHGRLKKGIETCSPLFQKVKTLNHPLGNLNDKVFQQVTPENGKIYVEDQLVVFLNKASKLHHRYIAGIDSYKNKLTAHYDEYTEGIERSLFSLNETILGYSDQLGPAFEQAAPRVFQVPFLISKKNKKVKAAQKEVSKKYRAFRKQFEEKPYFEYRFPDAKAGMLIAEVIAGLKNFDAEFQLWKNRLEGNIQEEVIRLNSKTAHPSLDVRDEVLELEHALDAMLEELNEAGLYRNPYENKTLTVPQRQKYLESIIEQLENTQINLRDFSVFYHWQSSWLQLGPLGQKVVKALVKVKPKDWVAAFESWYFNSLLQGKLTEKLPTDSSIVADFDENWHSLKPLVLNHIYQLWQGAQVESLKKLKKADRKKYQLIFQHKNGRNEGNVPLGEVVDGGFGAISDILPVLFVSPHVALNVVPGDFKFDFVIYEEANRFSIEPATDIAKLGAQLAIFGSDNNNGNETSLLQYAIENDVPSVGITNRYEAPVRQSLSSQNDQRTFHFANEYHVENLEGRFHELESTNDVEAQHIIRLLNQVKQTPQRVFPSVGIVAFTKEQRDLIASYLLKLKQQNVTGSEKIRQLERNGMGVYYVDELFGQQFDILIVSCTFGAVNIKGKMAKKIVLLNTPEGMSHLQMIINKPVQQLHLVHSFSEKQVEKMKGKPWDKGTWLLAHFIQLAEASRDGNDAKVAECLEVVGRKLPRKAGKNILAVEIAEALQAYVDPARIQLDTIVEDIILPLVIDPVDGQGKKVVVHPDGFFADTAFTSGVWEKRHRMGLEKRGLCYIPVWSADWLKNPEKETRRLASQIIKMDNIGTDDARERGKTMPQEEHGNEKG